MTNIELQALLKQYPDDTEIFIPWNYKEDDFCKLQEVGLETLYFGKKAKEVNGCLVLRNWINKPN